MLSSSLTGQVPEKAAQRIHLVMPQAPAFASGRDVDVRSATLRLVEFVTPVPKQKLEYLKLEVWLTNAELDVCSAPELAEIETIPLRSPDEFILVWQGVEAGWGMGAKGGNRGTLLWQDAFAHPWSEGSSEPAVLGWYVGGKGAEVKFELLPNDARESSGTALGKKSKVWQIRTPLTRAEASMASSFHQFHQANWVARQTEMKKQKEKEWQYGTVLLIKKSALPVLAFDVGGRQVGGKGVVQITRICPGIFQDKKFFLDDKVPR